MVPDRLAGQAEEHRLDCLFCRIVAGTVERAASVFEDENFLAFLDHRPLFPGHCLLIPKRHYETPCWTGRPI